MQWPQLQLEGFRARKALDAMPGSLDRTVIGESIKGLLFWFWQGSKELALYKDQWFENRF